MKRGPKPGPAKLTFRQAELHEQLTRAGADSYGLPLEECHESTVNALMRLGLVTVWYGQVILVKREEKVA